MGLVGVLAGIGLPSGALPAILYVGFVPLGMTSASGVLAAVFVGCFALLGCVLGVVMARRIGARAMVPGPEVWRGHEGLAALLGGPQWLVVLPWPWPWGCRTATGCR